MSCNARDGIDPSNIVASSRKRKPHPKLSDANNVAAPVLKQRRLDLHSDDESNAIDPAPSSRRPSQPARKARVQDMDDDNDSDNDLPGSASNPTIVDNRDSDNDDSDNEEGAAILEKFVPKRKKLGKGKGEDEDETAEDELSA
ncbi:hypothetical protein H0H92_015316 [Tricholoma furcatifolium]|nr:hypothetical protein H0H92_015316 [Tricholoma furcatifolium]